MNAAPRDRFVRVSARLENWKSCQGTPGSNPMKKVSENNKRERDANSPEQDTSHSHPPEFAVTGK
jgi:hypothetical protein